MFAHTKGSVSRCRSAFALLVALPVLFVSSSFPSLVRAEEVGVDVSTRMAEARERAAARVVEIEQTVDVLRERSSTQTRREAPQADPVVVVSETPAETPVPTETTTPAPVPTETKQAVEPVLEVAPAETAELRVAPEVEVAALAVSDNLIANGSFELGASGAPQGWTKGSWGSLTPTFTYPVAGVSGSAARVSVSGYASGDAKWAHAEVPVTAGSRYTYRDRYQASVATDITAQFKNASGAYSYVWLGSLPASTSWGSAEFEFVVPSGIVAVTIFHVLSGNGSLSLDEVSLTPVDTTTPPTKRGMVSVTFDDGWVSQYTDALPILDRFGVKGTFYLISDTLVPGKYTGYMTRAQALALHRAGHEIGGHSVTHPDLTRLNATQLKNQLVNSKNYLQKLTGAPVRSLAYPFGAYNAKVITAAKSAGYTNARTVEAGLNVKATDAFKLKGYSPTRDTPLSELTDAVDQAAARGEWMVIAFHEINTSGREYANTPEYLEAFLAHLSSADVDVVTVQEGFTRIRQ